MGWCKVCRNNFMGWGSVCDKCKGKNEAEKEISSITPTGLNLNTGRCSRCGNRAAITPSIHQPPYLSPELTDRNKRYCFDCFNKLLEASPLLQEAEQKESLKTTTVVSIDTDGVVKKGSLW